MTTMLAGLLAGCSDFSMETGAQQFTFSFDGDASGWRADGSDLDDPPVEWSIALATDAAASGSGSMKFFLDNMNDAGKIWIERAFSVQPNTTYDVTIRYKLRTRDYGEINLWPLLASAGSTDPETIADFETRGDTGNRASSDIGYTWVDRELRVSGRSSENGTLWIALGVWGTWETPRTYWIDNLSIAIDP